MAKIPQAQTDNHERVYNLMVELQEAETDRKETVRALAENIKRIKAEIKELIEGEEAGVVNSQNSTANTE